ncbi:MAG: 50S ribosomal protein L22 [Candidatus Nanohaloarchaeota archaeon QJJ-9]|nr:50S ribosomal protein L22 [Candidatus Nanohaloarchaeota archaeon QJJ-9]
MTEEDQKTAKARGVNVSVSRKHSTEVGNFIKNDSVEKAKEKLEKVINKEQPVPYKKFNKDLAHKKGDMGAGRYPVNASEEIMSLVKSAESNAVDQGMSTDNLYVSEFYASQGEGYQTPKRHRGRKPKSANITIKLRER